VKKFDTSGHLISMLFSTFAKCNSLREVSVVMLGLSGKTDHFHLKHIPKGLHCQMLTKIERLKFSKIFTKIFTISY
jgi:hypothetical protein